MISEPGVVPPLKWPGGKHYLTGLIWEMAPRHRTYLEPYGGGLRPLLARDPADKRFFLSDSRNDAGVSEVVSDADPELLNFWTVLADETLCPRFIKTAEATPFSERAFEKAVADSDRYRTLFARGLGLVDRLAVCAAVAFFVRCRQSLAGTMGSFAPTSKARLRRAMNEQASGWLSAVAGLPSVHARLKRVLIRKGPALPLIREFDDPSVFQYLDPPYPHDTRQTKDLYRIEMTLEDHKELLEVLRTSKAKVMLSSSPNPLYDEVLKKSGWRVRVVDKVNSMTVADKKAVRQEAFYMNYGE